MNKEELKETLKAFGVIVTESLLHSILELNTPTNLGDVEEDLRLIMAEDLKHDNPRVISNYKKRFEALTRIKKALSQRVITADEIVEEAWDNIVRVAYGEASAEVIRANKKYIDIVDTFFTQQKEAQDE